MNGIPFVVIENKRPTESLKKAGSQLIGYQSEDNIPQLFHFAQLLLTMNRLEARYATVGTQAKFWQTWRDEEDRDEAIAPFANRPLTDAEKDALFSGDFAMARPYFEAMAGEGERALTAQDRTLFALCRPERLLDLVRRFTVFEGGVRKIARHPQFFGIRKAVERVKQLDLNGIRKGGVIWHTQGSGKSLTMVMLGRALALDKDIPNPRIIIVTDRDDLDRQIKGTFKSCEMEPIRATSGTHLVQLIRERAPLVTTIINKFDTATRRRRCGRRRRQYLRPGRREPSHPDGTLRWLRHVRPQDASHPPEGLLSRLHRHTALNEREEHARYLRWPDPRYPIGEAVADGAVVPLLYEGRMIGQQITGDAIDRWFDKISQGLTDKQKADLKRKFSRIGRAGRRRGRPYARRRSTSRSTTGSIGRIRDSRRSSWRHRRRPPCASRRRSTRSATSPARSSSRRPTTMRATRRSTRNRTDLVRRFWAQMMDRYKTEEEYNRQIIDSFKGSGDPEILIVVSKLLTGFDAPRNTVLYICKSLREHNLLQAIARVNRLFDEGERPKPFGFIIDYEGLARRARRGADDLRRV